MIKKIIRPATSTAGPNAIPHRRGMRLNFSLQPLAFSLQPSFCARLKF
jgi:hypothetical protein